MEPTAEPGDEELAELLTTAPLEPVGRFTAASNATLLCRLDNGRPTGEGPLAVYKPARGEQPLWDFPPGTLHRREVAAFVIDRALGWQMVPPTVLRGDAPYGPGSVQLFVEHDPARHYFALLEEGAPHVVGQLKQMVLLDLIVNNTDRKASHVLLDAGGRVRLVDHGVCFHVTDKLRTVAWDFADQPLPEEGRRRATEVAARLRDPDDRLRTRLCELLSVEEVAATARRAATTGELTRFPAPRGPRPLPWPPL